MIRERALEFRKRLEKHPDLGDQAAENFLHALSLEQGQKISVYFPFEDELDTLPLVEELWRRGHLCLLPVFDKVNKVMQFARWDKNTKIESGTFGIGMPAEPEFHDPDILVVPVVAFDQRGHRLGYGKGYFDATLNNLRHKKKITAVGYAFAEQAVLFGLPTEPHDQNLDMIVTPQRVFDFR